MAVFLYLLGVAAVITVARRVVPTQEGKCP